jgi:hypothetical protein
LRDTAMEAESIMRETQGKEVTTRNGMAPKASPQAFPQGLANNTSFRSRVLGARLAESVAYLQWWREEGELNEQGPDWLEKQSDCGRRKIAHVIGSTIEDISLNLRQFL